MLTRGRGASVGCRKAFRGTTIVFAHALLPPSPVLNPPTCFPVGVKGDDECVTTSLSRHLLRHRAGGAKGGLALVEVEVT